MRKFLMAIAGVFLIGGAAYACDVVCQQQLIQPHYQVVERVIQPQYVQRVVSYVEVPKVRVVEKVRQEVVVQKQQVQVQKVVKQQVKVVRQPILQTLRQNLAARQVVRQAQVQKVQQVQIVYPY